MLVMKFGGTSVGSASSIQQVRKIIKDALQKDSVILVVSAMSGETNRLIALAKEVQSTPDPRELDVLEGIIDGLTNKMIARQLDISLHTVKFHVESVFRKLGARTRAEAMAKAKRPTSATAASSAPGRASATVTSKSAARSAAMTRAAPR